MTPSVSHQKARGIARQAQGRDGYRLAPPEEIVGCMSSPDTPHTRTQASTEGRQQGWLWAPFKHPGELVWQESLGQENRVKGSRQQRT